MACDREAVLNAWAAGSSCRVIAKRLGLQRPEAASVIIQRARVKGDPRAARRSFRGSMALSSIELDLNDPVWANLIREAKYRGVLVRDLGERLLRVVSADGMIDAVLDEDA